MDGHLAQPTAGQEQAELKSNPAIGNSQVQATRPPIVQPVSDIATLQTVWDKGTDAKLAALQTTEQSVAGNIVSRATQLQQSAQQSALTFLIITVAVLLIVLVLAFFGTLFLIFLISRMGTSTLRAGSRQMAGEIESSLADAFVFVNQQKAAAWSLVVMFGLPAMVFLLSHSLLLALASVPVAMILPKKYFQMMRKNVSNY